MYFLTLNSIFTNIHKQQQQQKTHFKDRNRAYLFLFINERMF